jgi:nitrate reductase delta subunit
VAEAVHPLKLASVLLQYPSQARRSAASAATELEIAPTRRRQSEQLRRFCGWYGSTPVAELQRIYVDSFDFSKQCSLHLTYHVHGDRRQRGVAMLELKRAYRDAGFEPPGDELPDFLPLMLEFAALAPTGAGEAMLEDHRVALELVRAGLARDGSPFAAVLDLVVSGLGRLSTAKLARMKRLALEGPPSEEVGLEPFAPPEVMPSEGFADRAQPMVGGWEAR